MESVIRMPHSARRGEARHSRAIGFTLVELLVVITILVVLLALLTPALDQAVYQAELAVCQARQKSAATGVIQYAMNNKRAYPLRRGLQDATWQWIPPEVASTQFDDRSTIFDAIHPSMILDPFCAKIDPAKSGANTFVSGNYSLWFGWRYMRGSNERGMNKIGDRFTWTDTLTNPSVQYAFSLLLSDEDRSVQNSDQSSHPDTAGKMVRSPGSQDEVNTVPLWNLVGLYATWSNWNTNPTPKVRGPLDLNYAYDDGSVVRLNGVKLGNEEERIVGVPDHSVQQGSSRIFVDLWRQIPRQ